MQLVSHGFRLLFLHFSILYHMKTAFITIETNQSNLLFARVVSVQGQKKVVKILNLWACLKQLFGFQSGPVKMQTGCQQGRGC